MPAGTYRGVTGPVPALAVPSMLLSTRQVPEADIYALMKALFSDQRRFQALSPVLQHFTLQGAVKGLPAPLHPGAAKFFAEQGVKVK